jgi:predicted SAM-dependent methyltransferase
VPLTPPRGKADHFKEHLTMLTALKRLPFLSVASNRRRLKQLPGVRQVKEGVVQTRRAYYRRFGREWLRRQLARAPEKRIVIGAWSRYDPGWIPTQREFLSLTRPTDWSQCLEPASVDALLAEHVWEHITEAEGQAAARLCYLYLRPGGYLRLAVPDGLHPDPRYVELVRAGDGSGALAGGPDGNAANHKALYSYRSLKAQLEAAGFRVTLYEYFDEEGVFHYREWARAQGTIWRSKRFDPRNRQGPLASVYPGTIDYYLGYSSIVLDAVKEGTDLIRVA